MNKKILFLLLGIVVAAVGYFKGGAQKEALVSLELKEGETVVLRPQMKVFLGQPAEISVEQDGRNIDLAVSVDQLEKNIFKVAAKLSDNGKLVASPSFKVLGNQSASISMQDGEASRTLSVLVKPI